jgi:predicted DNA-binding transcriptional regulator AlpA
MDDLVSASEIAHRLGSERTSYVHDIRRRHPDFPKPVSKMGSSLVWSWTDVEKWARRTGRLK